jgi:hypothetical protein
MEIITSREGDASAVSSRLTVTNATSASVASRCWLNFFALRRARKRLPNAIAPTGFLTLAIFHSKGVKNWLIYELF